VNAFLRSRSFARRGKDEAGGDFRGCERLPRPSPNPAMRTGAPMFEESSSRKAWPGHQSILRETTHPGYLCDAGGTNPLAR
jgi:hypothetical protein